MKAKRIIIVGAGQAGAWAAITLRKNGYTDEILLIGEEEFPPYDRPPLSKDVLKADVTLDSHTILSKEKMEEKGISFCSNRKVMQIFPEDRFIQDNHGEKVEYDKLILCTGGNARLPLVDGIDIDNVYTLRTREDALALRKKLQISKKLVVIGGGWIGLEVAASAREMGLSVSLVEANHSLCERSLSSEASQYLLDLHKKHDVNLILDAQLSSISPSSTGCLTIHLTDKSVLSADLVVIGIGMVANDSLAKEAGIVCNNGIIVDQHCRSSVSNIFAAGDVATISREGNTNLLSLQSWQNSQDQGITAALNALDNSVEYNPVPQVWSEQFDQMIQIFGSMKLVKKTVLHSVDNSRYYLGLDETNKAVFMVSFNGGRNTRLIRRWIESGSTINPSKFQDIQQPIGRSLQEE